MNKLDEKIRLENLIKSKQSVHTICQSQYSKDTSCNLIHFFNDFKCGYKVDEHCTYDKFDRGYN